MREDECKRNEFVDDLRSAFDLSVRDAGYYARYTKKMTLIENALSKPAKSFYVSFEEGARRINAIEKTGDCGKIKDLNAQKYKDLHREFVKLREKNPNIPTLALIQMAINRPAPRFYIKPQTAALILNRNIK
ncbi:MAG: hypothetical protein JZU53_06955 [Paludibacter sp.]|nr:hypothetical protein [Paludibacter sp.]